MSDYSTLVDEWIACAPHLSDSHLLSSIKVAEKSYNADPCDEWAKVYTVLEEELIKRAAVDRAREQGEQQST